MKKYTFGIAILLLCLTSQLSAQKVLDKAADASCECIKKRFDKTKEVSVNETAVNSCIQEAFLANIDGFSEEYGMEVITDQKQAYKIGEQLGLLIAKDCPTFIDFSMQMAEANAGLTTDAEPVSETGTISGKVLRLEQKEFVHLILENQQGRETDFIWLRYFEGSDQFKGQIDSIKGKTVTVSYRETEVYLPKMQDYFKVREITSISSE